MAILLRLRVSLKTIKKHTVSVFIVNCPPTIRVDIYQINVFSRLDPSWTRFLMELGSFDGPYPQLTGGGIRD